MAGVSPLQPEQIMNWIAMAQIQLCQEEIDLIIELDRRYRISMGRELEKEQKAKASKPENKEYSEYG